MKQPFLIFVDGPMGSGKTTTTKLLNSQLPDTARIAFSDIKRLIPDYKENEKTKPVIREVVKVMIDKYLEFGVSVVVEQVAKREEIEELKKIAENRSVPFHAYRMDAPKHVRWERVQERTRDIMDVSELPDSKVVELQGYFETNDKFYEENPSNLSTYIDTLVHDPTEVVAIIKNNL